MNWFDPNVASPLSVPGLGTLYGGEMFDSASVRTDWDTDWKDFQPRFGLAYQLGAKPFCAEVTASISAKPARGPMAC